jgi:predicted DNA-binding transcriptional regulator AlpA
LSRLESAPQSVKSLPDNFNSDRLVSDPICAELLGISLSTLRRLREQGEGPPRRRISQRRFGTRLRDIAEFLNRAAV